MTDQQTSPPSAQPAGRKPLSRRARIVFVLIAVVAVTAVYFSQRQSALPSSWRTDLAAAEAQAKQENRRLLVVFLDSPPGEATLNLIRTTLTKGIDAKAIRDGNLITVRVVADARCTTPECKRFAVTALPTMLILAPDGTELNRRVGMVGQMPFIHGFLEMEEVVKRPAMGATSR
jgi:hypothetical protein